MKLMFRKPIALFFLFLMPIYVVPVLSMHICIGQEHHHGNCDGNMSKEDEQEGNSQSTQLKKAKHLECFALQKEQNPCAYCKVDIPVQQVALLMACYSLDSETGERSSKQVYQPPPNKEPPSSSYCIRPPPIPLV